MTRLVPIFLFLACFGSFAWGLVGYFHDHGVRRIEHQVVKILGSLLALLHLALLVRADQVPAVRMVVASALYIGASWLFWASVRAYDRSPPAACFVEADTDRLIRHGPYARIRHPFYCAYVLGWLGGVVFTGQSWLLVTVAIMAALYVHAAVREERAFARGPLSLAYAQYQKSTGMFLPFTFAPTVRSTPQSEPEEHTGDSSQLHLGRRKRMKG